MRVGLLPFGEVPELSGIAEALRDRDIDVVLAEEPAATGVAAVQDAARLHRADCDGVAFVVGNSVTRADVAEAALHVGHPILLAGGFGPAFFDAAGALAEIGVPFDRLLLGGDAAEGISTWLHANRKTERQRGIEAAHKLYGQRVLLGSGGGAVDPAQWQRQFGVTLVLDGPGVSGDFVAPDGDAEGALTLQLLRLLSGAEVRTVTVGVDPLEAAATYARLGRRSGRFLCCLFVGDVGVGRLAGRLLAGRLHAVAGDHIAAVRAACEALDVEVVMLD